MASTGLVGDYGSSDEEASPPQTMQTASKGSALGIAIDTAPAVASRPLESGLYHINPNSKQLAHNPTYDELYAPNVGPQRPGPQRQKMHFNTFTGHIEAGDVNAVQFEDQMRTFASRGYAMDPTISEAMSQKVIGNKDEAAKHDNESLLLSKPVKKTKRKRQPRGDPADLDNYLGPWAAPEGEKRTAEPTEEEKALLEQWAKDKKLGDLKPDDESGASKRAKDEDEEHSILHLKEEYDYQGRTWMEPAPQDRVTFGEAPERCFLPKKQVHTWQGHTKGVNAIRFIPKTGHLLLSAGLDSKIKLWKVYDDRQVVRTYLGHIQGVRDIAFNRDGTKFVSCGYDRYCRLWDTETGQCLGRFTNNRIPYCVKFHPDEDKQHLFVTGTADRKILTYDCNTKDVVQEYDRHLGAVNTITFVEDGKRMVTTSDDKSLRVWEWDIPVDIKYIADPAMHSMPSVALNNEGKWLACQSMDNKVVTFSASERFRPNHRKTFKGHLTAGYACQVNFSPDNRYVLSGDAHGFCCIWDWTTTRMYNKFKAHDKVCIGVEWNPYHPCAVATCGWDGLIKYWM